jgi:hypothetical protein
MLSKSGRMFYFGCSLVFPILQLHYEDWLHRLDIPHWVSEGNAVGDWLIEEMVFPGEHEQLDDDYHRSIARDAEKADKALIAYHAEKLRATADELEIEFSGQGERLGYILYCLLVVGIVERFEEMMNSPAVEGTEYQRHYRDGEADFRALQHAVHRSAQALRKDVALEGWNRVQQLAEELADKWLDRVRSIAA